MRILLTGPTGQVGSALLATLPEIADVVPLGRSELDLANAESIKCAVRKVRPDVIVNAAAYTAVDRAEKEEAFAFRINRDAPALLADEALRLDALLVHFSTDYVFDGDKQEPYIETDKAHPINAYGRSKHAGELEIQDSRCRHLIFRVSWVYSGNGANFMLTMLRLAREGRQIRVVDDQHGAPTSSRMIAQAVPTVLKDTWEDGSHEGLYHMSASGSTTWCGFAREIVRKEVIAISTEEYPAPARRPRNSVLDNSKLQRAFGIQLPSWQSGLNEVLKTPSASAAR